MDDESTITKAKESLKEEFFSKFKLKMLSSGFTQNQCELATACFITAQKEYSFPKHVKTW